MKYTNNAINILTVRAFKGIGIGRAWIVKNFRQGNLNIDNIITLLNISNKGENEITKTDFDRRKEQILETIYKYDSYIDGIVALDDPDFPQYRGVVKNSERPIFLFYKGDISLLQNTNIAVIGLLNPDKDIEQEEKRVVSNLVENNVTIISGLALGCDTIAHRHTLDCGGKTIAILPGPLSSILPASNKDLAKEIVNKGGLLISEYLTEAKSKKELSGRYQERDRLQALFSDGIILSASYAKNDMGNDSGSRLAMEYAKNYKIKRAVIYDDKFAKNPKFDLNRQYLEEDSSIFIIDKSNSINKWLSQKETCTQYKLDL